MTVFHTYNLSLSISLLLIAILIAYAMFDLASQLEELSTSARASWSIAGAVAIGAGLWLFQWLAVQIFHGVFFVQRNWTTTLYSLVLTIAAVAMALLILSRKTLSVTTSALGSIFFAALLLLALYICMWAVKMPEPLVPSSESIAFSVLLALFGTSLPFIIFANGKHNTNRLWVNIRCASLLGLAIYCSHIALLMSPHGRSRPFPSVDYTGLLSATSFFVIGCLACVIVFMSLLVVIAGILNRRISRLTRALLSSEERHRVSAALGEQRAMRVQTEALIEGIRERRKIEDKLSQVAFFDNLTGLHNRAYFIDAIAMTLTRSPENAKFGAVVLYIDIDDFKTINDMLGHKMGDELLVEVAQRLKRCIRNEDVLSRIEGDKFTLLLPNLRDPDQALRMARRLLDVIEEPVCLAETLFPVSASIGICGINASYTEAEDVLRDADTAMYCAKRSGGAHCVVYHPSMYDDATAVLQTKLQLKTAIENNEFLLYYQPLVDMRDRSICGFESLIRWNHPSRGIVGPGKFIQLAEETGHIVAIGTWVLRQACKDFHFIRQITKKDFLLTLNVSSRQLESDAFLNNLSASILENNIDPHFIQLEITESIFLKDATRIGELFQKIRALGVKIAFDDFGTGYSSLSYLARYPIDTLKIDQSFVQQIDKGAVNADIVRHIISLARTTGMKVSAEGVEEPEQAATLIEFGCNISQGYLYSKPVPLGELIVLLEHGLSRSKADTAA